MSSPPHRSEGAACAPWRDGVSLRYASRRNILPHPTDIPLMTRWCSPCRAYREMEHQHAPSLFDAVDAHLATLDIDPRTKARNSDPDTSHRAAHVNRVHRGNQRGQILMAHLQCGMMTDDECQAELEHIRLNSLTTRRSELVGLGMLKDSGERRRTTSGSEAVVWMLTADGAAHARAMLGESA